MNLEDTQAMRMLMANGGFDAVINLGAQAGVRYSITNPHAYIESNVDGFISVLEGCRDNHVKHLVYASSSSVYGLNGKVPFSEHDGIAHPVSLYAATKKSNELMAHAYSKLYGLPTTGLRFFTVYGPWGRPDMSPFLFMDAILHDRAIKVFNNGDMLRDFTALLTSSPRGILNGTPHRPTLPPPLPPIGFTTSAISSPHASWTTSHALNAPSAGRQKKRCSPCSRAMSTRPMPIRPHWPRLQGSDRARS